ncbi:RNA helicase, variant 3 [Entomophthora muscae]|nr:RNA helicase, variant 3 [Entomophthora muscae]
MIHLRGTFTLLRCVSSAFKVSFPASYLRRINFSTSKLLLSEDDTIPCSYTSQEVDGWESLGLEPSLRKNIKMMKISTPNSVQRKGVPLCMGGTHVVLTAETGSGKTLVYATWMVQKILEMPPSALSSQCHPLGLVIVPSKELIWQVALEIKRISYGTSIALLFDRSEVLGANPDSKRYILISTPVALAQNTQSEMMELMGMLERTCLVAIDEMDLLLSGSFANKTQLILARLSSKPNRQFVFCGASLDPSTSKKAIRTYLYRKFPSAKFLDSESVHCTVPTLDEKFVSVPESLSGEKAVTWKLNEIYQHLELYSASESRKACPDLPRVALVFLNDISSVVKYNNLAKEHFSHEPEIKCIEFHKKIPRQAREDILKSLKLGWVDCADSPRLIILFTTDLLARGIDIPNLDLVLQASFPQNVTVYLHRVGRTARAGRSGQSISYVMPQDYRLANEVKAIAAQKDTPSEPASLGTLFSRRRSLNRKLKAKMGHHHLDNLPQ